MNGGGVASCRVEVRGMYMDSFLSCFEIFYYFFLVLLYFLGHGITTDGHTKYINASTCTLRYKPQNPPIVFDYPIPEGHSKEELLNVLPQRIIRHYKTGEITVSKNE